MEYLVAECRFGNVETLRAAINQLEQSQVPVEQWLSTFHELFKNHQFEMAREILRLIPTQELEFEVMIAISTNNLPVIQFLWPNVEHCINHEQVFEELLVAMTAPSSLACFRFLWNHGVRSHSQKTQLFALQAACLQDNVKLTRFLFYHTPLPTPTLHTTQDFYFCSACHRGNLPLVKRLMQSLISRKNGTSTLQCALSHAKFEHHMSIVAFLQQQKIKAPRAVGFYQKHNTDDLDEFIHSLQY